MLAIADKNGYVAGSVPGLAHVARVSREECEKALKALSDPDVDSRTQDDEGRRIELCEGGWVIINYTAYRERLSELDKREYFRLAKRRQREDEKVSKMSKTVQDSPRHVQVSSAYTSSSLPFGSEGFKEAWTLFEAHRAEIRKKLTPTSVKLAFEAMKQMGEARAIAMIRHTISKGWQGLKEDEDKSRDAQPKPKRSQDEIDAEQARLAKNFENMRPIGGKPL